MIFLGYAQVESIIQENRGRTTPSGRPIIEKIAKIKDYGKFSPPKIINSRIQESIRMLPNYNNQHSIVPITKDIYNLILSDREKKEKGEAIMNKDTIYQRIRQECINRNLTFKDIYEEIKTGVNMDLLSQMKQQVYQYTEIS